MNGYMKPVSMEIGISSDNFAYPNSLGMERVMAGEPFKARCPECGSTDLSVTFSGGWIPVPEIPLTRVSVFEHGTVQVSISTEVKFIKCNKCGATWDDCAEFVNAMAKKAMDDLDFLIFEESAKE